MFAIDPGYCLYSLCLFCLCHTTFYLSSFLLIVRVLFVVMHLWYIWLALLLTFLFSLRWINLSPFFLIKESWVVFGVYVVGCYLGKLELKSEFDIFIGISSVLKGFHIGRRHIFGGHLRASISITHNSL